MSKKGKTPEIDNVLDRVGYYQLCPAAHCRAPEKSEALFDTLAAKMQKASFKGTTSIEMISEPRHRALRFASGKPRLEWQTVSMPYEPAGIIVNSMFYKREVRAMHKWLKNRRAENRKEWKEVDILDIVQIKLDRLVWVQEELRDALSEMRYIPVKKIHRNGKVFISISTVAHQMLQEMHARSEPFKDAYQKYRHLEDI